MAGKYPEGPLTILFSDVQGSTDLRTQRGDAAAHGILRSHEAVVRSCVGAHDGREVKALGDGFMVAFASARKALSCAVAIQHGLGERNRDAPGDEVLVRIGINTGEVMIEGDDLYGQAVNAAARIAARADGGEILVSEIVRQLVGSEPGFTFRDRGRFRLKGFPERWHLYAVAGTAGGGLAGAVSEGASRGAGESERTEPSAASAPTMERSAASVPIGGRSGARTAAGPGIRLLGPFELIAATVGAPGVGPAEVEIGSVMQRAVLALLALRVNEVVSREALLDRLWSGEPPASATATLRGLVSRLRRVLAAGGTRFELQTRDPGWVLRGDPGCIDTSRFETLLAGARARLAEGDAPAAAVGLRHALGLWRGDALVDIVGAGYLAAEATRLDEARLGAVEDLAEAELAAGWAPAAVDRLEPHVAAHPLRERAWGQLMTGLYHLGRQAEALRAYQRLRGILGDELGIDPTPALTDLETRMLRQDPALARPPVSPEPPAGQPAPPVRTEVAPNPAAPEPASSLLATGMPAPGVAVPDRAAPGAVTGAGERTPFVGRESERAVLGALFGRARAGRGGMVLIGGEPGIGKTRLAKECAAEAAGQGMGVLVGHSYEMAGASPYVAVVEILEAALEEAPDPEEFRAEVLGEAAPEIARLIPQLRRRFPGLPAPLDLPPAQERLYLFRCLSEVFARLAATRATVVLFDDLQWADEPTLGFIEHLAPQLAQRPLAVVATYRDADVGRPLANTFEDLHRRRLAQRIRLGALSLAEAGRVVGFLAGQDPPPGLAAGLHAATEGNTFFLEEVVSDLVERGRLLDADGRFREGLDVGALGVPEGVRLVVSRRLARLSDDAQRLLAAAAVAGRVFSFRLLSHIAELGPDGVLDVLDEAEQAMLIEPGTGADEYLFSHELIRQTLTAGLSNVRRRRAHLRAAEAMMATWAGQLDEHAAEIAHHLTEAGDAADPKARFTFSLLAGQRALGTSAFQEALAHLERAAALEDVATGPERAETFYALGRAHRSLGRLDEGIAAWERTISEHEALDDAETVGRVCAEAGTAALYAGHLEEAVVMFRRGLAALGDGWAADRARLLTGLGFALDTRGDPVAGDACFGEARRLAGEVGDDLLRALVEAYRPVACHSSMRAREAVTSGLSSADGLRAAGELWVMVDTLWPTGWGLVSLGRFDESVPVIDEFVAVARRVGHFVVGFDGRIAGPREFYRSGDLDVLERWIRHDIELSDELMGGVWNSWPYAWMGTVEFLRGDWPRAGDWFRRAVEVVVPGGYAGWPRGSWFLYLAYSGRREEALALVEEHAPELPVPGRPNPSGSWALLFAFTEGLYTLGERDRPAAWYPLIVEAQQATGVVVAPYAPGQLLERVAAIAATAAGDHDTAEAHYRSALRQADELPHRFEQFETRRFYARLLTERSGPGDADRARALLGEAAAGFTRLGMPRHAEMATAARTGPGV